MITDLSRSTIPLVSEPPVPVIVHDLMDHFRELWWQCDTSLPDLGRVYSLREKLHKEKELERNIQSLLDELRHMPREGDARLAAQDRLAAILSLLAKSGLGLDDEDIRAIQAYGFADVGLQFIRMARQFDPLISDEHIYQASRNVWSMNFMQLLTGMPVQMTPAIFAYSMLYPYTDNYLDDPEIPLEVKRSFNERFRQRVAGGNAAAANRHEAAISNLTSIIEGQYDRTLFPQVYESLLAIHHAQGTSLELLRRNASPYEVDVLGSVFEKGGTSVLADGYLVAGTLTPAQREWMFFYGVFTQLMDDMEDVQQDIREGCMTIFSQTARRWPLDAVTNRTIHLGRLLIERLQSIDAPGSEAFKIMIAKCLDPLLIASVGQMGRFYTRPYLRELESHLPVRFGFILKQRRKFSRVQLPIMDLVEAFVLSNK